MNRVELAKNNFKKGYNCSQAVVSAYCDLVGVDLETAMRFSECFGGGMGRMRLTCGAVSGMFILASLKYSSGSAADMGARKELYAKIQELAAAFKQKYGSIICSELLGVQLPKESGPVPTARTAEFYKKRPCINCIGDCAALAEELLFHEEV